jgi:rhodanese-related sulfurtransferase
MGIPAIQVEELKQRLDAGESLFLLDVREEDEYEISNIGGHLIPLAELPERVGECQPGDRCALQNGSPQRKGGTASAQRRISKCPEPHGRDPRVVGPGGPESPEILKEDPRPAAG